MPHRSRPRQAAVRDRAARARDAAQARRTSARHRRQAVIGVTAAAVLLVVAGIMAAVVAHRSSTASPRATEAASPAGAAELPGLQATPPPWQPEYAQLPARLAALHFPPNGDENYHIHAHIAVYAPDGQVSVPTEIGIDEAAQVVSPMHTHDTSGVIHVEAAHASDAFTLGAFFDVWGVAFSDTRLGSYTNSGGDGVHVYVNGSEVHDVAKYPLHAHDSIVVGYGTEASVPHTVKFTWPEGV